MNGYKIVLLKAIFMLYRLPESERVCSGICIQGTELQGLPVKMPVSQKPVGKDCASESSAEKNQGKGT